MCGLVQGADATYLRVRERCDNRFKVIRPESNVAVADHQNLMAGIGEPTQHVVDLAVGAGTTILDRETHPVGPELPLDFLK